jgi:hypothetical protein
VQAGRRRYRCDTDHRNYCSSLLERYEVPPAQEAIDDNDEDQSHEEQVRPGLIQLQVYDTYREPFITMAYVYLNSNQIHHSHIC